MLKKFLNFFKPEGEDQDALDPKLSYLDFLLEHIEAPVLVHLDQCADHDPFLLAIVEALRVSMPETWSSQMRTPLTDEHTPTALPPAPPTAPPPPPAPPLLDEEETKEMVREESAEAPETTDGEGFGEFEEVPEQEEASEEDEEAQEDEVDGEGAPEEDEEAQEDEEEDAATVIPPETAEGEEVDQEIESIDDSHIMETTASEASPAPQEHTQEFSSQSVHEEFDPTGADGLPRIDRDEVLQAGRVYLGMLIENDRLPPKLQLSGEETVLARDLLVAYFLGKTESNKAQKLLRLVEQKFSEGKFSQARLLLQLFQAERQTRIRNDRNIFYEDMIQRLGTRRKNPVSAENLAAFKALEIAPAQGWSPAFAWLHERVAVDLHLFLHQTEKVEHWRAIAQKSTIPHATEYLLRYIPPKRWRPLHWRAAREGGPGLGELMVEHMTPELLSRYVSNQLRTCYFVLRAVGDTGLEGFLDTFFEWTTAKFDLDMTLVLPELYRRTMGDVDTVDFIFKDLYARTVRTQAESWFASLTPSQIQAASLRALEHLTQCDLNDILPGHYDFGSLVFDQLLEVAYPTKEFAFKIHRLV